MAKKGNFTPELTKKTLKSLKVVGQVIEAGEFVKAVYNQVTKPSTENFDNVMLEGIDVLASLITIPFLDMVVKEGGRSLYIWGANKIRQTLEKSEPSNPFDLSKAPAKFVPGKETDVLDPDSTPSNGTPKFKAEVSAKIVGSLETDHLINNDTDGVEIKGNPSGGKNGKPDIIENYTSDNVSIEASGIIINLGGNNAEITATGKSHIENISSDDVIITDDDPNNPKFIRNRNSARTNIKISSDDCQVENYGSFNEIDLRGKNNFVNNWGSFNSIKTGDGNNTIFSVGDSVKVSSGNGDDEIYIAASKDFTASAVDGENYISIDEDSSKGSIVAGAGADYIEVLGSDTSVDSGAGNDSVNVGNIIRSRLVNPFGDSVTVVSTGGKNNFVDGGAGDDFIYHNGEYVWNENLQNFTLSKENINSTLIGGAGNDFIFNLGNFVTIEGGADNDSIDNRADNVKIDDGADNDSIENSGANVSVNSGDGSDKISNSGDNTTIVGGSGDDNIDTKGKNILVDGADYIINGFPIDNFGKGSIVFGGAGNNTIVNYANYVLIDAGSGENVISNSYSKRVTILAGAGNDKVDVNFEDSSLNTGAGDDVIALGAAGKGYNNEVVYYNLANNGTVNAGAGNNVITNNDGEKISFVFAESTNSTINGFNSTDKIILGNGSDTYSVTSADDFVKITSNDKEIILAGQFNTANLNIVGQKQVIEEKPAVEEKPVIEEKPQWSFKKNVATCGTTKEIFVTVSGVKSIEGLSLEGTTVVIDERSLSNKTIKISSGYTLELDASVAVPEEITDWKISGSTATLKKSVTSGYILSEDNRTITYKKPSKEITKITLTGLKKGLKAVNGEIEGIYVDTDSEVITLSAEVLGTSNVKVKGNYTLELEGDVPEPTESTFELSVSSAKLNVKPATAAGYVLATNQKSVSYKKAVLGKVTASVYGLIKGLKANNGELEGVNFFDNSISISGEVLSKKVSVSGSQEFYFDADFNDASVTGSKTADTITVAGSNLTISGGKGNDYLVNEGTENTFVYASGDGNDVIANFTSEDKIKISKGTVNSVKTE